jgi:phosphopentomutase
MSSRSARYLANADKCQQCAEVAYTPGTKRLYGVLTSQWRQLAEEAEWTDRIVSQPLLEIRHADFLQQIDKAEYAIQEFGKVLAANNQGP